MKKIFSMAVIIFIIFTVTHYILNYTCSGFTGSLILDNSIKKCVTHYGLVKLKNVKINKNTYVSGKIIAENVMLNDIHINGDIYLSHNSIVIGNTNINGSLITSSSKFENPIYITTDKIELNEGSTTKDIYIRKHSFIKREEFVYIDSSTVNGNITFEGNLGRVILINGSIITGKIFGGEIITN
ncbi:hypothetical protein [Silvanigrella aquatica]|uniref:Uncharacterized protein n=1 Tax=Silvanigrella aquatica TaxID=1915309 RepID=A0A1L4D3Y6_9BACT|nr:hypothetical protein [Silvanigrella aquatica]APJ04887.1 hypothetical protein AXG55_13685 [Silvanigrella aquatica]